MERRKRCEMGRGKDKGKREEGWISGRRYWARGENRVQKCGRDRRRINGPRILTDASIPGAWILPFHLRLFIPFSRSLIFLSFFFSGFISGSCFLPLVSPPEASACAAAYMAGYTWQSFRHFLVFEFARFIVTGANKVAAPLIKLVVDDLQICCRILHVVANKKKSQNCPFHPLKSQSFFIFLFFW